MKLNTIMIILSLFVCAELKSQNKYENFIYALEKEYRQKENKFLKYANNVLLEHNKHTTTYVTQMDKVEYLFIPKLLLEKHRDSFYASKSYTKLIDYIDTKSIYAFQALVSEAGQYIGSISPRLSFRNSGYSYSDKVYAELFEYIRHNNIDLVFEVYNESCYFAIKNNSLFALIYENDQYHLQEIDEYLNQNMGDPFNEFKFRYTKDKIILAY